MQELSRSFYTIFAGNEYAHGEYSVTDTKSSKLKGKALTVKEETTIEHWTEHLTGKKGLGIVPIMSSNNCVWGCVDIDIYDTLDLEDLSSKLPDELVLCRSKSGGAHIFMFMEKPAPANLVRKKLALVARAVGHPNAEIFPKQDRISAGDCGNWLNMPYFNHESTNRYALKGGIALSTAEFVDLVTDSALTLQQLAGFQPKSILDVQDDEEFADAPPCLRELIKNGFPTGTRNSGLFSMGVYARKKFPTGWEDKVFEYNTRFMGPGSYSEVAGIIRSLSRKVYVYKCKDQPLAGYCDREECANALHGVMQNPTEDKNRRPNILEEVSRVRCYAPPKNSKDEPYWVFSFPDHDLEVTLDMARSQTIFSREFLRQFHKVILPIKDSKWASTINELLATAEIHEIAPDAGPEGQMFIHLEDFCTNKAKAKVKDELILGKPWLEDDRIYFRSSDFHKYLSQQRFYAFKEQDIWTILKRHGGKHHKFNIKGKCVACWSIRSFTEQKEGFSAVGVPDESDY